MSQLEKVLYTPDAFGLLRGHRLRRIAVLLVAVAALAGGVAFITPALDSLMKSPPRSSWTKSRTDTATGS